MSLGLSFAVSKVAQSMHNPTVVDWITVKRILRYLVGTTHHVIYIRCCPDLYLSVYCDADWGGDKTTRKSTSGFMVFASPNLMFRSSCKQ